MKLLGGYQSVAAAGLLSMAAWAPHAAAGHVNDVLEAQLNGLEEVPADASNTAIVGDPNGRAQAYVFGIDDDPKTLCYALVDVRRVAELEQPPGGGRAAHIHEGTRGTNGPIVANLAWPQNGQAADCLTEGEAGKFPTGEAGIVQRILKNPSNFYVNVHNSVYPGGAIRGQLVNTQDPEDDEMQQQSGSR
ncbi:MAG TPA: CHRD domain-containing protein [Noviherbaspirillum sp.]|uniref:CHRD domain-containing protein n=1 Tax=Noviherbaspirillum sp. TaxID=1926288 RepID=UPI002D404D9A|nr:CHRD domain-containing protein [Noviherbaspirillum sp.]HYD94539.1 CHRD domain-containing protein [Noviherbaspirillum sp.]